MNYSYYIIANIADFIFREVRDDNTTPPSIVGQKWTANFLSRYPDLRIRISKLLSFDRQWVHDPDGIQEWFSRFGSMCASRGVQWQDIWNFDETGFLMGVGVK